MNTQTLLEAYNQLSLPAMQTTDATITTSK